VEYLSVSNSSFSRSGQFSIDIELGNQRVDKINSSMNNARQVSGIFVYSPSEFTCSYCTFSDNKVSQSMCLFLYISSGIIRISFSNIINNNSQSEYGIVCGEGKGTRIMSYCIFHNNENHLFYNDGGFLRIIHSFINHSPSSLTIRSGTNNSINMTNTYQIQFFSSLHCNADMPLPNRTPDQSPKKSLEESPVNTLDQTIGVTQKETIQRSYEECVCSCQIARRRQMNVIISLLYPGIVSII